VNPEDGAVDLDGETSDTEADLADTDRSNKYLDAVLNFSKLNVEELM